jgi:exodeoxyribonuclease-5
MFEPERQRHDFSPDQQAAWTAIAGRLAAYGIDLVAGEIAPRSEQAAPADVLAVTGKAGSGKTVLLAELAHRLGEIGLAAIRPDWEPRRLTRRSFAVLAPTNKAASVLRARGVPATTIHRIIYTPVYDPEFEKLAEWLTGERATRPKIEGLADAALERAHAFYQQQQSVAGAFAAAGLRGADFITGWKRRDEPLDIALVDEASMLDEAKLADLKEIFGQIVLFGDPAQLAPVMGQGARGAMVFESLPDERRLALARIHRQAADNPILDLAHLLGEPQVDFAGFERALEAAAARDDRVRVSPRADAELMCASPMLVWRNRTRVRLIRAFRATHGCPERALVPGEPLICDGLELPLKRRKERIELEARGLIKGAQATYLGPGRKPGYARVNIHGTDEPGISVASIIQVEGPDEEEPAILTAASSGALFLHGAAVTIHKAQGSQWPSVQVFAPDLFAAARAGQSEAGVALWKRLAYVAITRAEERLIWVTRYMISKPAEPLGAAAGQML